MGNKVTVNELLAPFLYMPVLSTHKEIRKAEIDDAWLDVASASPGQGTRKALTTHVVREHERVCGEPDRLVTNVGLLSMVSITPADGTRKWESQRA